MRAAFRFARVALLVLALGGGLFPGAALADVCDEPNGTFAAACFLGTDFPAEGTLDAPTDLDVYHFNVPEEGATIHATLWGLSADAALELFSAEGVWLVTSSTVGTANEHILQVAQAGRYYLIVSNGAGAGTRYALSLSLDPVPPPVAVPSGASDTCPEPNDDLETACYMGTAAPAMGTLATPRDADIYSFDMPAGGGIARAMLSTLPADYDLFLSDGEEILGSSARGGTLTDRVEVALQAGKYYLEVRNAAGIGNAREAYTLTLAIDPPAPPDICAEPNDTPDTACFFGADFPAVGTLATSTDLDFYVFEVPEAGARVRATLSDLPADYDLYLVTPDAETVLAQSIKTGTATDEFEIDLSAGRYLLAVVNAADAGNSTQSYTLTLAFSPRAS